MVLATPSTPTTMKPHAKVPVHWWPAPMAFGSRPPASAPTSPIKLPATAVDVRKRCGTSWNTAPLPAPSAEKATTSSTTISQGCAGMVAAASMLAMTTTKTPISRRMPPTRSAIQPPATRSTLAATMMPAT